MIFLISSCVEICVTCIFVLAFLRFLLWKKKERWGCRYVDCFANFISLWCVFLTETARFSLLFFVRVVFFKTGGLQSLQAVGIAGIYSRQVGSILGCDACGRQARKILQSSGFGLQDPAGLDHCRSSGVCCFSFVRLECFFFRQDCVLLFRQADLFHKPSGGMHG